MSIKLPTILFGVSAFQMKGGVVTNSFQDADIKFKLDPSEVIVPKRNFNNIIYTTNPTRKCYHAKNTMKLKHFKRKLNEN